MPRAVSTCNAMFLLDILLPGLDSSHALKSLYLKDFCAW